MRNTTAFLLAGGMGSRLNILGWMRAKPAVPFGGCYRLIDFTMSNIMHSGIQQVGILTQYQPYSLMGHIGSGEAWDLIGRTRHANILPPSTGIDDYSWYLGTADAIAQNISFAERYDAKRVLVLSGDHIYRMNYAPMIDFHKEKKAEITIAMMHVPWEDTRHFGIAMVDNNNRIIDWEEKPEKSRSNLASMGVYVFNYDFLKNALENRKGHDFGKNIINDAIGKNRVYAYLFDGYWADVGTLQAYWKSNMDILVPQSGLRLHEWAVRTNIEEEGMRGDRPPIRIGKQAVIKNSLISVGSIVEGNVTNSILSPGVRIEKGAQVVDSVVMHDAIVEREVVLSQVIADKRTRFGVGCHIGVGDGKEPNQKYPDHLYSGLSIIGKDASIPPKTKIYRNSIVEPRADADSFKDQRLEAGSYIRRRAEE
jgi:glucose-1-phosphate adenylyltransferase